jgi:hypothetical protein
MLINDVDETSVGIQSLFWIVEAKRRLVAASEGIVWQVLIASG